MPEGVTPPSVHAVVLAGGHGSRMPPLVSSESPKALLTIANRPMLFYSLFTLYRARINKVTVIVQSEHQEAISEYVHNEFPKDEAVAALKLPVLDICVQARAADADTADALRQLAVSANDTFVLSSDAVFDAPLEHMLQFHRFSNAACTAALVQVATTTSTPFKPSAKSSKSSTSSSSSSSPFTPDHYALLTPENRLLTLLHPTDLESSSATVSKQITRRYAQLTLRSDLRDAHIYCFHTAALRHVLEHCRQASSVRYDLVPYVARRQHTLWRVADRMSWTVPGEDFRVYAYVLPASTYAARANTVGTFRAANLDVAGGRVATWLNTNVNVDTDDAGAKATGVATKKKEKKGDRRNRPSPASQFAQAGEHVSVSADSVVGAECSAGDRTSVKKSVVGKQCVLGEKVKLNGCVLLSGVRVADGANLNACVVCDGGVIGARCVLKECRVAAGTVVEEGTEASGRAFGGQKETKALGLSDGLGDDIDFY